MKIKILNTLIKRLTTLVAIVGGNKVELEINNYFNVFRMILKEGVLD